MRSSNAQEGAAVESAAAKPLQVRGRFITAAVLPVTGVPEKSYFAALDAVLQQSPQFFSNAPLVLDVEHAIGLDREEGVLELLRDLRLRKLSPIGIQNATESQSAAAARAGLTTLQSGGRETPLESRPRPVSAAPKKAEAGPASLLVTEPVRSGQRIVSETGDLVVVAPVSSGAELVASGSIHVYGRLRGRALAGANGDRTARIFCQSLEAELIAIAGLYKTSDAIGADVARNRVQAFLQGDTLCIEALK